MSVAERRLMPWKKPTNAFFFETIFFFSNMMILFQMTQKIQNAACITFHTATTRLGMKEA